MIKVSVCMLCYNHSKYLKKALDSVINQKTTFDIEILIYDDASTDNSQQIIMDYEKRYPDLIKPYYQKENQYQNGNHRLIYEYCIKRAKGEFIALCECDDYWLDENKLQYQYDFLKKNHNFVMHVHSAKVIDENGVYLGKNLGIENISKTITLEKDMRVFYPTASKFIKKSIFDRIPEYYYIGIAGDLPMMLIILSSGDAYYEGKSMSAYRMGVPGSANTRFNKSSYLEKKKYIQERVRLLEAFNNFTNCKYNGSVSQSIVLEANQIVGLCSTNKEKINEYREIKELSAYKYINMKTKIKLILQDFLPFYCNMATLKNRLLTRYGKLKAVKS